MAYTKNLKISPELYAELEQTVKPLDHKDHQDAYRKRNIPRADRVKDIDRRYRWDLLWAANRDRQLRGVETIIDQMYAEGLNDSHIDSALKAIIPPL